MMAAGRGDERSFGAGPPDVDKACRFGDAMLRAACIRSLEQAVPSGCLSLSVGDVTSYDGAHLTHRAATISGMSGAGIRNAHIPHQLLGIHIAGPDDPQLGESAVCLHAYCPAII